MTFFVFFFFFTLLSLLIYSFFFFCPAANTPQKHLLFIWSVELSWDVTPQISCCLERNVILRKLEYFSYLWLINNCCFFFLSTKYYFDHGNAVDDTLHICKKKKKKELDQRKWKYSVSLSPTLMWLVTCIYSFYWVYIGPMETLSIYIKTHVNVRQPSLRTYTVQLWLSSQVSP